MGFSFHHEPHEEKEPYHGPCHDREGYNEGATDQLVRQIDPKLRFSRNYEKIRPYSPFCEERIEYRNK